MTRELLGDRAYHQALRRLGVKNPGDVPIGVPVILTAKVDDLSHAAEPLGMAVYGFTRAEPAVAGELSGVAITGGSGGIWWRCWTIEPFDLYEDATTALTGTTAVTPRAIGGEAVGVASRSTVVGFHMTAAALGAPAGAYRQTSGVAIHGMMDSSEYYLAPSQRLIIVNTTVNQQHDVSVIFREVPSPGQ